MLFTVAVDTLIPDFESLYYFNNAVRRTSVLCVNRLKSDLESVNYGYKLLT